MSRRRQAAESVESKPSEAAEASSRVVLRWGLVGAVVTYLAHPPVGWSLLAWIGPAAWIAMVSWPQLPGRRPYRALWVAGLVYWLLTIAWLRLPFQPMTWASLAFVASYLGLYLPVFVGLSRVAVHRLRWPVWIAAPVVWTGLELARAHLLTGFLMGSLADSQYRWPLVLGLAEYGGEYAVTFVMVLTAALVATTVNIWRVDRRRAARRAPLILLGPAAAVIIPAAASIPLGMIQIDKGEQPARIALIQSDMLSDWKGTAERDEEVMVQQADLSRRAVRESAEPLDLIVWPETMFRMPLHQRGEGYEPPRRLSGIFQSTPNYLAALVDELQTPVLVGVDRRVWRDLKPNEPPLYAELPEVGFDAFNSCVMVDRAGEVVGTYDKMHLLPFGEYVPLVDWMPLLRRVTPITGGAIPGAGPASLALPLASDPERIVRYAPNICYETALPHVIRSQVAQLAARGETPDVLVNLTNDAWYWGSAELDMHLAAGVLRAVETRTPLVIAANRGLSASISAGGLVRAATPRDQADVLIAEVRIPAAKSRPATFYVRFGDWLPTLCLLCCTVFAAVGWRARRAAKAA